MISGIVSAVSIILAAVSVIVTGVATWRSGKSKKEREAEEERISVNAAHEAVKILRGELQEAHKDLLAAKEALTRAHEQLDDAQKAIRAGQDERTKLRSWIRRQKDALDEHQEWDVELVAELEKCGVHVRPAPPLSVPPPNGDFVNGTPL